MTEESITNMETEKPIFICHNSENSSHALALALVLEMKGLRTWMYELDSAAGADRDEQEAEVISDRSMAMVALVSIDSTEHPESIISELTLAKNRKRLDPSYRLAFYTVGVPWSALLKEVKDLLVKIVGKVVDPLELDPTIVMAPEFNLEKKLAESDPFLTKLFETDLKGLAPEPSETSPNKKRIQRIRMEWQKPNKGLKDVNKQGACREQAPIVISYNTGVSAHAVALALVLEVAGFRSWIYELDSPGGEERVFVEGDMIGRSQALIVLFSKSMLEHPENVIAELNVGRMLQKECRSYRCLTYAVDIDVEKLRTAIRAGRSSVLQTMMGIIDPFPSKPRDILEKSIDLESMLKKEIRLRKVLDIDLRGLLRGTPDGRRIQVLRDMLRERVGNKGCVVSIVVSCVKMGRRPGCVVSIMAVIAIAAFIVLSKIANYESPIMVARMNAESNSAVQAYSCGSGNTVGQDTEISPVVKPDAVPTIDIPATKAIVVPATQPIKRGNSSGFNVKTGAKLSFAADVPLLARYILKLRYSNDHFADEPDKVRIVVAGRDMGPIVLQNTHPEEGLNRDGWANIVETNLDIGSLEAGSANIDLIMEQTDIYGAEIHGIVLTPTP